MSIHVMIDLETMGNEHDAAITQIGAVTFDPAAGEIPAEFSMDVLLSSSVDAGLALDASTIAWWMEQEGDARAAWVTGQRTAIPLGEALAHLKAWLPRKAEGVWSHGATFDLPILSNAHRAIGLKAGWGFRDARDTRTLFWLCGAFNPWEEAPVTGEIKHRAVDDARRQARAVMRALAHLGLGAA